MELQPSSMVNKVISWEQFAKTLPQVEIKTNHHFSYGVYAREIQIPADTILTGEIHKHENLNILIKGTIKVSVGEEIELIQAPCIIVSPPGTKRIAHTITECVWVTIHGTHERNLEKIREEFIIEEDEKQLELFYSKSEI